MTVLILEDETPAAEKLIQGIKTFDAAIEIAGPLRSVREAVRWLTEHPAPDLILADIQLTDGLSLDIFRKVTTSSPVIFTTAHDAYLFEALEHNSIDYLLKPIKQEKLEGSLKKYLRFKQHFSANLAQAAEAYERQGRVRDRIVVKKGNDLFGVKVEEIAYFYTEHKVVFVVDRNGTRYMADDALSALEERLDPSLFFRVNRKFLVHVDSVKSFKTLDKGKLQVELNPMVREEVVVSQENAAEFRRWMEQ